MGKTKNVVVSGENKTAKKDKYALKKEEATSASKESNVKARSHGKRFGEVKAMVDKNRLYPLSEALDLVIKTANTKFVSTVEMHAVLRKAGAWNGIKLPNGTGKSKKVVMADANVISELESGKINFDVLLATTDTMPKLVKFAKLLGPRGLMPNPKNGTLVKDESAIKNFSTDTISIKTEKSAPVVHLAVGKADMGVEKLEKNVQTVISAIGERSFMKIFLSSSMGPSVKVELPR